MSAIKFKHSISFKIIMILLACTTGVTSIFGYFYYVMTRDRITRELDIKAGRILDRLSYSLIRPMWDFAESQIDILIDIEIRDELVSSVIIKEKNGEFYRGKTRSASGAIKTLTAGEKYKKGYITLTRTIKKDDFPLGSIELEITDLPLRQSLVWLVQTTATQFFILSLIIIAVIYYSFERIVTAPIKKILKTVNEVEEGNLSSTEPSYISKDELGLFAGALNRMVAGLRGLMKELAQKNKELESIVYVASHDLRSPIINLLGFSQCMEENCAELRTIIDSEKLPPEVVEKIKFYIDTEIPKNLQYIKVSGAKMDSLINGLLRVSRIGRAALNPVDIDMNELIQNIVLSINFQLEQIGASVTVGKIPSCSGEPEQICQVFSNLIDNAIKYRDVKKTLQLSISGEERDGEVVYAVADNGIGIQTDHQEKIWELFHRLHPKGPVSGEGLGLTLARRIISRHNGRIWVESEPEKGSTFFISLPAVQKKSMTCK